MERNNTVAAPQIADVEAAFERWRVGRIEGRPSFYRFMTTPSVERDRFMADAAVGFSDGIAVVTLK